MCHGGAQVRGEEGQVATGGSAGTAVKLIKVVIILAISFQRRPAITHFPLALFPFGFLHNFIFFIFPIFFCRGTFAFPAFPLLCGNSLAFHPDAGRCKVFDLNSFGPGILLLGWHFPATIIDSYKSLLFLLCVPLDSGIPRLASPLRVGVLGGLLLVNILWARLGHIALSLSAVLLVLCHIRAEVERPELTYRRHFQRRVFVHK